MKSKPIVIWTYGAFPALGVGFFCLPALGAVFLCFLALGIGFKLFSSAVEPVAYFHALAVGLIIFGSKSGLIGLLR